MDKKVTLTQWDGKPGIICMPMQKNIPEGRPDWELQTCDCGQKAWLRPEAKRILKEVPGMQLKCTECAIKASVEANKTQP